MVDEKKKHWGKYRVKPMKNLFFEPLINMRINYFSIIFTRFSPNGWCISKVFTKGKNLGER